jgi:hypothetical protein
MSKTAVITMLGLTALVACSDDAAPPSPDLGQADAALDLPGDAPADLGAEQGADASGLSGLVTAAINAGCTMASLQPLAGLNPAAVRQAVRDYDAAAKLGQVTVGHAYLNPITATLSIPAVQQHAADFTYTVYVPAGYSAGAPLALWIDPAHPLDPLKDTTKLPYLSKGGQGSFLVVRVNFINVLYTKLAPASYKALSFEGMAFEQDYNNVLDAAIAAVKRRYHVDPQKIFISGISAKGASAWHHGIFSADQYAAIHPISIIPVDFDEQLYLNLSNVGIYVWQGDQDTVTPISKVEPMITKIKSYGLNVFYYVHKGGGHGTGWYPSVYMPILLKTYSRSVTPERVHKGIKTADNAAAYWLAATKFSVALPASAYKATAPPAVIEARWTGKQVDIEQHVGIREAQIYWLSDSAGGPGRGRAGETLTVLVGGKASGTHPLVEHPTVAVEDYCRHSDTARLWAGRVVVKLP